MMRVALGVIAAALSAGSALAADVVPLAPPPVLAAPTTVLLPRPAYVPDCGDPAVLSNIARKFAFQEANITHSGLVVVAIDGPVQTNFTDGPSLVDVRYCSARALLNNGRTNEVVYIIEAPMKGAHSLHYAVESCLPGFDPYRVYDGNCRSIRPVSGIVPQPLSRGVTIQPPLSGGQIGAPVAPLPPPPLAAPVIPR